MKAASDDGKVYNSFISCPSEWRDSWRLTQRKVVIRLLITPSQGQVGYPYIVISKERGYVKDAVDPVKILAVEPDQVSTLPLRYQAAEGLERLGTRLGEKM